MFAFCWYLHMVLILASIHRWTIKSTFFSDICQRIDPPSFEIPQKISISTCFQWKLYFLHWSFLLLPSSPDITFQGAPSHCADILMWRALLHDEDDDVQVPHQQQAHQPYQILSPQLQVRAKRDDDDTIMIMTISIGDWLLLYQMNKNMNKRFFAEFLALLSLKVKLIKTKTKRGVGSLPVKIFMDNYPPNDPPWPSWPNTDLMFWKCLKAIKNEICQKHQLLQVNPVPYVECDPEVIIRMTLVGRWSWIWW